MTRAVWRLLREPPADGSANMARDEALLAAAEASAPPSLRLYAWSRPTLSLGAHQVSADRIHAACRMRGVELVRRPTGGGAVLHDRELTYAVVGRIGESPFPSSVVGIYERISAALVAAVVDLGVDAEATRSPMARGRAPADCFAAPSSREVLAGGSKLIGSAQVRRRGAFLQHGSILIDLDRELLASLLRPSSAGVEDANAAPRSATTLAEQLGRIPAWAEVADAVTRGFAASFGAELRPSALTSWEAVTAERLRAAKYLDAAWTLQGRQRSGALAG